MKKNIEIKSSLYNYTVNFIDNFSNQLNEFDEHTVYVIDKNVFKLYNDSFFNLDSKKIYLIDADEHNKNMNTVLDVITKWQELGVRKNWNVVCIGGGITQDITTIASNLFLRNVNWYFFPTTLLSMSDSCIGGKCGINFNGIKNQIGVFYPPKKIFIDTNFINTLTDDDYINGWGEILKFSLTEDEQFYNKLKKENQFIPCENISSFIYLGLLVKKKVIEEDEFEGDKRRILNYGHTFGHALEAYSDNLIPHGKGVIWGIDVVNYIAYKENLISREYYEDIKHTIKQNFIKNEINIENPKKLFDIIKTDKKVKNDTIYLAVLNGKSSLRVYPMDINEKLFKYFNSYLEETHDYYIN